MRLLIADDDAFFRVELCRALMSLAPAVEFLQATDRKHAMELTRTATGLEMVLLDPDLPGFDGQGGGVLKALRQGDPDTPVVVLSVSERPKEVVAP